MATVNIDDVTEYQDLSAKLEGEAQQMLLRVLNGMDLTDDGVWDVVINLIQGLFGYFGRESAYLGAQWYQRCRDIETDYEGVYVADSFLHDWQYERVANTTKDILQSATDNEWTSDDIAEHLANNLGNFVAKVNRDNVLANLDRENEASAVSGRPTTTQQQQRQTARRKGTKGVRFMRVPRADCKCAFCITMASRGAVYHTRETAGGGDPVNRYHRDCRCSVVPVDDADPEIDGYQDKVDYYYDLYAAAYAKRFQLHMDEAKGTLNEEDLALMQYFNEVRMRHYERPNAPKWKPLNEALIIMRRMYPDMT